MKKNKLMVAIIACAFVMPVLGQQNQTKRQKVNTIKKLSAEVVTLAALRATNLNHENLDIIIKSLTAAKRTLNGRRPSRPVLVACASDLRADIIGTEQKIQNVAKNSFGMHTFAAEKFAANWSLSFPCNAADQYAQNAKKLKEIARGPFGLHTFDAEKYAKNNVEKLCSTRNAKEDAQKLKDIARNRGMHTFAAERYAKSEFEKSHHLKCQMSKVK